MKSKPNHQVRKAYVEQCISELVAGGKFDAQLFTAEKLEDFATATIGLSLDQIDLVLKRASTVHALHLAQLKVFANIADSNPNGMLNYLFPDDYRFWMRHRSETEAPGWDQALVSWQALMETLYLTRFQLDRPEPLGMVAQPGEPKMPDIPNIF